MRWMRAWLVVAAMLGSLLGGLGGGGVAAAQTGVLSGPQTLQVLVRTLAGQGVPGLGITLVPQPASLGGPVGIVPPVSGTTDRAGQATIPDLRPGMWRVQLT